MFVLECTNQVLEFISLKFKASCMQTQRVIFLCRLTSPSYMQFLILLPLSFHDPSQSLVSHLPLFCVPPTHSFVSYRITLLCPTFLLICVAPTYLIKEWENGRIEE